MAPEAAASLALAELARQIRLDLQTMEEAVRQVARGAGSAPDEVWMAFIAVHIDRCYTAAEAAFERIAHTLGEPLPSGGRWHDALLHQMTLPVQDLRPAVLRPDTETRLRPLLEFRHWLRHAYRVSFEWPRMQPTVQGLPAAVEVVRAELEALARWLEAAAAGG